MSGHFKTTAEQLMNATLYLMPLYLNIACKFVNLLSVVSHLNIQFWSYVTINILSSLSITHTINHSVF